MSLTSTGRDIPLDADSFSYLLEHKILLSIILSSWKEKDQTAHMKHTTCCWSNLIDCMQFPPKHNKIYVKHRAVLAYNLPFAGTNICDIAYQVLLTPALSFWTNLLLFDQVINHLHHPRAEQPAEAGSHWTIPLQPTGEPCVGKGKGGRNKMQAKLSLHGMRICTLALQTCFPLVTLFKARLETMRIPGWRVWPLPQGVDAECEQQPCSPEFLPSAYPSWWFLLAIFPPKPPKWWESSLPMSASVPSCCLFWGRAGTMLCFTL